MTDQYTLRDFLPSDKEQILDLFELSFERELPPETWDWRYLQNATKPVVKLLYNDSVLIAHNAVNVFTLKFKEKEHQMALAMTIMTHPDYQGKGLFPQLAEKTYLSATERGILGVFGFPNKRIEKSYFKHLDWVRSNEVWEYALSLDHPFQCSDQVVIKDPFFDDQMEQFWESISSRFDVIIPRSKEFLIWRITDCPPAYASGHYKLLEVMDEDKMVGYLILKIYTGNQPPSAHILELLTNDDQTAEKLLQTACHYAHFCGARIINSWIYRHHMQRSLFETMGFKTSDDSIVLGGRLFQKMGSESLEEIFSKWHISMLDSDVF